MRYFEKISYEEFRKVFKDNKKLYEEYSLPHRATLNSAGYDFYALEDYTIKAKDILKIPTGIKANMEDNEVLLLIIRSSLGFKYNLRLINQVGVIDSDYYNNIDNEGHIFVGLENRSDKDFTIKKGEAFVQGIFMKYETVDDDEVKNKRIGGIGSTRKGDSE